MTIGSNISSIYAHQGLLVTSAHNIANANTDNFERTQTNIVESSSKTVDAVHQKIENNYELSNTDLTKEIPNQIIAYNAVGANAVALQTKSETEDTLIDMYA